MAVRVGDDEARAALSAMDCAFEVVSADLGCFDGALVSDEHGLDLVPDLGGNARQLVPVGTVAVNGSDGERPLLVRAAVRRLWVKDAIDGGSESPVGGNGDNDVRQLDGAGSARSRVSVGHAAQVHDPGLVHLRRIERRSGPSRRTEIPCDAATGVEWCGPDSGCTRSRGCGQHRSGRVAQCG